MSYFTTPIVEVKYSHLGTADAGPDGTWTPKFKVTIALNPTTPGEKDFLDVISLANKDAHREQSEGHRGKPLGLKTIIEDELDEEYQPTGRKLIKISSKFKPIVLDSAGNTIPDEVINRIGNGSKLVVCFTAKPFTIATAKMAGLVLHLHKAVLVELKEPQPKTNSQPNPNSQAQPQTTHIPGGYVYNGGGSNPPTSSKGDF